MMTKSKICGLAFLLGIAAGCSEVPENRLGYSNVKQSEALIYYTISGNCKINIRQSSTVAGHTSADFPLESKACKLVFDYAEAQAKEQKLRELIREEVASTPSNNSGWMIKDGDAVITDYNTYYNTHPRTITPCNK